jgi:PEP-CTERM motif
MIMVTMAIVAICCAPPMKADTIFSNLASGQVPGTVCCGVGGFGINAGALAVQFVPQSTFVFTDTELPLAFNSGTTNEARVFLMTDSAGKPGTVLEDFTIAGLPSTTLGTIFTFTSTAQPVLDGGTAYWLAVTPADSTSSVSWRRSSTGADVVTASNTMINLTDTSLAGPWQSFPSGGLGQNRPAFQIDGTPIATTPEPSSLLLLGSGLLGLAGTTWRKKLTVMLKSSARR